MWLHEETAQQIVLKTYIFYDCEQASMTVQASSRFSEGCTDELRRPGSSLAKSCPTVSTHRLQSSSFLGLPYRILNMDHKKELLWSLWVS